MFAGIAVPHLTPWPSGPRAWDIVVPRQHFDDELNYIARVNHWRRHGTAPSNVFLWEHRHDPPLRSSLNERLIEVVTRPFGSKMRLSFLFVGLLMAAVMVFGMNAFLGPLAGSSGGAALFVAVGVLWSMDENVHRMIHPQANSIPPVLLGFLALWRIWNDERPDWKWGILAVACSAWLDYSYVFHAIYFNLTFGALAMWNLGKEGLTLKTKILQVSVWAAALCAVPFLLHYRAISAAFPMSEIHFRFGDLSGSHFPSLRLAGWTVLAAAAAWFEARGRQRAFFACAFVVALVLLEQHVVTGAYVNMLNEHFQHSIIFPILLAFALALGRRVEAPLRTLGWPAALLVMALFAGKQAVWARGEARAGMLGEVAAYRPVLDWLDANAGEGEVVVGQWSLYSLAAAYTGAWGYQGAHTIDTLTRQKELVERTAGIAKLFGLDEKGFRDYARRNPYHLWGFLTESTRSRHAVVDRFGKLWGKAPFDYQGFLDGLVDDAAAVYREAPLPGARWRADYLVYGPQERAAFPDFDPARVSGLEEIRLSGDTRLWRLKR